MSAPGPDVVAAAELATTELATAEPAVNEPSARTGAPALCLLPVPGRYAVCRLAADAPLPPVVAGSLWSLTRTADELSLVCDWAARPPALPAAGPFAAFRVAGTLDLALTGILARLSAPLAAAGVSLFALSTYDTDYLLVPEPAAAAAVAAWQAAGFGVAAG